MHSIGRGVSTTLVSLAIGGGLAACSKESAQAPAAPVSGAPIASLPLSEGPPPPAALAPSAASLPPAPPVQVVRTAPRERYRYINRAYALGEAFGDTPPDYTVPYQGERPWIWRSRSGDYRVIEPTPEGQRIYYYDAGSDEPFLVRDPEHAYGYDRGRLAAVYDRDGLPIGLDPAAAERAARYDARARALHEAAVREQRQAAYAAAWRERRDQVMAEQQAWAAQQQRDADWRAWREEHQREDEVRWDAERAQRQAYASQIAPQTGPAQAGRPRGGAGASGGPGPYDVPSNPTSWRDRQGKAQPQPPLPPPAQHALQAAAQQAQAEAARKALALAAQQAAAQQAQAAARAQQQAQAGAARRDQAQAAQKAAVRQQADAAAKAQQQAQAAQQAAAQQAQAAAKAQRQAQAEAARKAQAQAAERAAAEKAQAASQARQQAQGEADRKAAQQQQAKGADQAAKNTAEGQKKPHAHPEKDQKKADDAEARPRGGDRGQQRLD